MNIMAKVTQQRIQSFAFVISVGICTVFSVGFVVSSFVILRQPRQIQLDDTINPNDAPAASLMRLPSIGLSRAEAIVAYRNDVAKKGGDNRVFRDSNDLQKVRGIGPTTVQNIGRWLKFE